MTDKYLFDFSHQMRSVRRPRIIRYSLFLISIITAFLAETFAQQTFLIISVYALSIINCFAILIDAIIKKNFPVFILFFFISLFILPLYYPLFTNVQFGALANGNLLEKDLYFKIAKIQLIFLSVINIFIRIPTFKEIYRPTIKNNNVIFYSSFFLFFIFTYFGKQGNGLLSGDYSNMEIENRSSVFEYAVIPFISAALYSNSKEKKILLFAALLFYIFKNTLFGGRIETVIILFSVYLIFFLDKFKFRYLIAGIFVIGYIMIILDRFRANPTLLFDKQFDILLSPITLGNENRSVIVSQESEVNYSSLTILKLLNNEITSLSDRIEAFGWFLLSIFMPSSAAAPIASLTQYAKNLYGNLGGGLLPVNFYVYGGYIGTVLIAIYIAKIINANTGTKNGFMQIYSLLVFITIFRWFNYSPIILFKLCLFGTLFIYLITKIKIKRVHQ